jgi:hypothetical protein
VPSSSPHHRSPWWASTVALLVTVILAGVVRLLWRHRSAQPADGGAYAPEPLTGDPTSVDASDVAPV